MQRRAHGAEWWRMHEVRIGYIQGGSGRRDMLVLWWRLYISAGEYVFGIVYGAVRSGVVWGGWRNLYALSCGQVWNGSRSPNNRGVFGELPCRLDISRGQHFVVRVPL